ncbi:constituent protein [Vibrio phage KIT05]|nr:constituent protein [Vibrio phage KIT05]
MAYQVYKVEKPKGVNFSLEPSQLDSTMWDEASEVSFKHGKTKKVSGYEQGLGQTGVLNDGSVYPEIILPLRDDTDENYWWAYASTKQDGTGEIYRIVTKDLHQDVTPTAGIPSEPEFRWFGDTINGVPYFMKGKPYVWDGVSKFEELETFPGHVKAQVMRTYGNHMVAMDFQVDNFTPPADPQTPEEEYQAKFSPWNEGRHRSAVWWSSAINTKDLSVSWADADPTTESGWNFLGGNGGPILGGKSLRESFIIYRERAVWQMSYIGGILVFAFKELFNDVGVLGPDCVAEINGYHFVVGQSDIYMHNGVHKESVADGIVRNRIFDSIDPDHIDKVFVAVRYQEKEAWVCIPEASTNTNGRCNVAYVYNWEERHWSKRDMPDSLTSTYTILSITEGDVTWTAPSESATWEEATDLWISSYFKYNSSQWGLAFAGVTSDGKGAVYTTIDEPTWDGANFKASVEKKWIDMEDYTTTKTLNKIWPLVRGGDIDVWVAGSETTTQSPNWRYVGRFDPNKRANLGCTATGKFIHVKFEIPEKSRAELRGYWLEYKATGAR